MSSPVQQAIANRSKKLIICAAIIVGGLWIALIMYFMADNKYECPETKRSVVAVRAASPVTSNHVVSSPIHFTRHTTPMIHHSVVSTPQWSLIPAASMSSTSSMTIHLTSSATVHSVGSGGGSGLGSTSGGQSNGSRGVRAGGSYGSMLALASSVPLASPGAEKASEMANVAAAPERNNAPIRKVKDDPFDPFLDPVGDVTWGLFALLTIAWCVRVRLKKQ